ncbi:nectin-4-like [Chaetodon auriga]|uniref:nectin-4-like n=1 Tax=Chaetodon auriga TaxID=39042 RepID=UPI004032AC81
MFQHTVIHLFCVLGVIQRGLTALVQTQQTVMAAEGEEAHFSCWLTQPKDVLQVTWQKCLPDGEKNVCSFNKYFGQKVNPDFRDKVKFKAAGLQNSSIVIRNVTELDEGCYHCLFNTDPAGALTGTTCLRLYELHEPILHVRESNSSEEVVVSCSATGRPAPTVTLRVLQKDLHLSPSSSVTVTNSNGTVTVTTAAVLSGFHDSSTQVGCAARVLSGPQMEAFMMIPEVKRSSADGVTLIIVCVFVVFTFGCVTAIVSVLLVQKQRNGSF